MKSVRYITKEYIKQFLPDNAICIEAGGHIGRDALELSTLFPDGHVYTFEPVPHLFKKLVENTRERTNITAYHTALSNVTGTQNMYVSDEQCDAVSSLLVPQEFFDKRPEIAFTAQEVQTITLNDWAQHYNVACVDFMWLDLQGYELQVLQAATDLLHNVRAIHTEVNLVERYTGAPLYDEVRSWLEAQGFLVDTEALYRTTWGNVLFVR
jgi:FkbM family methyltransferase